MAARLTACLVVVLTCAVSVRAQAPEARVLAPARPDLVAVPLPQLSDLESAVSAQIQEDLRAFDVVARSKDASSAKLADAYGSLGRLFHAYEIFESAEPSFLNSRRLAPGDARWPHLLGALYQQTGRWQEAAEAFSAARRIRPNERVLAVHLGEVYLGLNRLQEARAQFAQVIDIYPAVARVGLGEVALRERRFAEAVDYFEGALQRAPQATSVNYSLAMAYRGLGRLEQARTYLQRRGAGGVWASDPLVEGLSTLRRGERALVMQGRRAYESGRFQEAAAAFRKALEDAPMSVTARVNLGLALTRLGDRAGAARQFEAALALEPRSPAAHAGLGMILAGQGRGAEAVEHLRTAFAQSPEDADVRRELVGALMTLGRKNEAIEVIATARSLDPDDEGMIVSLAILLSDQGRFKDALSLLEEANRRFPDRRPTATTLARLLASAPDASLRDGARALAIAKAIYDDEPSPAYAETVALALAELGRCVEAREWIRRAVTEAQQGRDRAEAARLEGEVPRYQSTPCRP